MLHAAVRSPQRRRLRGSAPRIPIALFQNRESRLHCSKTKKLHTRSDPENGKTIKQNPRLGPKSGKTKKQNKTRSSEDHSPKGGEGRGVRGLDHGQQLLHDLLVQHAMRRPGAARSRLEQFRSSRRCAGQGRNRQACKLPGEVRRDVQHGVHAAAQERTPRDRPPRRRSRGVGAGWRRVVGWRHGRGTVANQPAQPEGPKGPPPPLAWQ